MGMYTASDVNVVRTSRTLPQAVPDADLQATRGGRYGEVMDISLYPDMAGAAEEGTYFTCNNAQTGLATAAAPTAFSATNPFLTIFNGDSATNPAGKRILLDYVALVNTAIGTAAADVQFSVVLDRVDRYSSGGTNLTSLIRNVNGDSAAASVATIFAGNLTATTAGSQARTLVGRRYMKAAIPVVGDTYTVKFGGVDGPSFIGVSTVLFSLNNVPKVVIPPGWTALLYLWFTSQSAASSYAPEIGMVER